MFFANIGLQISGTNNKPPNKYPKIDVLNKHLILDIGPFEKLAAKRLNKYTDPFKNKSL